MEKALFSVFPRKRGKGVWEGVSSEAGGKQRHTVVYSPCEKIVI
jgi:hypothetical protein